MSSAKLHVQENQSQSVAEKMIEKNKAKLASEVIDEDGVVYKLCIPTPLEEFDLSNALGKESSNLTMLVQATLLLYIESIDGEPFSVPGNLAGIRASFKRLTRNGKRAIENAVQEFLLAEQGSNQQENIDNLKK
jgi:hypothetical protein